MRLGSLALLVIVAIVAATLPCAAAYNTDAENGGDGKIHYDVRAGVAFNSGDLPDSSQPFIGAEVEYPASKMITEATGYVNLTLDYMQVNSVAGDVNLVPIIIGVKSRNVDERSTLYFSGGVGLSLASDDIPEMRLKDGTNFAWQLFVGAELKSGIFLEGRFLAGPHPGDDGMTLVALGYRF